MPHLGAKLLPFGQGQVADPDSRVIAVVDGCIMGGHLVWELRKGQCMQCTVRQAQLHSATTSAWSQACTYPEHGIRRTCRDGEVVL